MTCIPFRTIANGNKEILRRMWSVTRLSTCFADRCAGAKEACMQKDGITDPETDGSGTRF